MDAFAGLSSSNLKVPYYTTVTVNSSTFMTLVTNDATDGVEILINEPCKVSFSMFQAFDIGLKGQVAVGLNLSAGEKDTDPTSIPAGKIFGMSRGPDVAAHTNYINASGSLSVVAGDVIVPLVGETTPSGAFGGFNIVALPVD